MDTCIVRHLVKRAPSPAAPIGRGLRSAFFRSSERGFSGFVMDTSDPCRKFAVEILLDGYPVQIVRADAAVHDLNTEQVGDGYYGFSCSLHDEVLNETAVVEARLANLGASVGVPIALARPSDREANHSARATVSWLGGLRFSGWIGGRKETAIADVLVDGALVTRVRASSWCHIGSSEQDSCAVRAFDFHLPEKFADGDVHRLTLVNKTGENIVECPVFFIAYPDRLRAALVGQGVSEQERLRADLFDRLLPMSVPFSEYHAWRDRLPIPSNPTLMSRGGVIMVGKGKTENTLATLEQQIDIGWVAASLPPTSETTGFCPKLAQEFLRNDGAECEFVVFTFAGTLFAPSALVRIAEVFEQFDGAQAVYCDLEIRSGDGSAWPLALPAFDYERMLEQGYCAHLFALRHSVAERALCEGAANLYRLINCIRDNDAASSREIVHLPNPLGTLPEFDKTAARTALISATREHLWRRDKSVEVKPSVCGIFPAVRILRKPPTVRTTVIIPTRNRRDLLDGCVESIRPALKRSNAEILIVDNDSTDPDMLDYLAKAKNQRVKVLRVSGEFNFPRLNNLAAKSARGDVLCFLNNDIKALDDQWLSEMLSRLAADDVGAVGALLVWPSGIVQHGGVVLGPSFAATHAFNDRIASDTGYGDLLNVAHECSAVTAACMVTWRRDYLSVGGMDELRFPVNFNDVDYCLKLRARGKRIVFTPHARLIHLESASRGSKIKTNQKERFERELQNLRAKWGGALVADPYYSPILSLDPVPFSALAWPARTMKPRTNDPPVALQIPNGF
jgi:O-antigen biosynthesis protein